MRAFAKMREALNHLSEKAGEYCGLPPMIEGEYLIVEPTHRAFGVYEDHNIRTAKQQGAEAEGASLVNSWWSKRSRTEVIIWRTGDDKLQWGQLPASNHLRSEFGTMACSIAWSMTAEYKALEKLSELIPRHLFNGYFMTGCFLETSRRSGVTYLFRRLRPTVAMRPGKDGQMKILCCLCMHPIGYYAETWAGSLCPTDDVMSHLILMRGDEKFYWKRCNQIPPYRPEAGL